MSKRIERGTELRVTKVREFKVPVCRDYFPRGLTPEHRLVAEDRATEGRVTVRVIGDFAPPQKHFGVWHNPCFRLSADEVEVVGG